MKAVLSKYIVKRRLEGGEFLYVYRPRGESVAGKKAVWTILKSDEKIINKLREASGLSDEEEFETVALKTIPLLPYEDAVSSAEIKTEVKEEADCDENEEELFEKVSVPSKDLNRSVIIKKFPPKASAQECEAFLRTFDSSVIMRREMGQNKKGLPAFKGTYFLTFSDLVQAKQFLDNKKPVVFNEKTLTVTSCVASMQRRTLFQLSWKLLLLPLAWAARLVQEDKRDKAVFGMGIAKLADQRLAEVFCGMEAEYENISTVNNVYIKAGNNLKYQFIQFEFNDLKSAEEFSTMADKTVEGKTLNTLTLRDYQRQVSVFEDPHSLLGISGSTENKIIYVHNGSGPDLETIFPDKKSVQTTNFGFSKVSIVEFATSSEASEASMKYLPDVPVGSIISVTDYLRLHEGRI